ncbi:hypothetical protein R3P38DRAFT_2795073 [Favolaschia claudopus]|uniref:Uncharacterized protein n=1 Tax=Favolaschia claudopus TaxID=2862362 RepID=A0AAW0A841_9AGAR
MYNSQQASGSRGQTTRGQLVPSRGARPPTRAKYTRGIERMYPSGSVHPSYGSQPSTTDPSIADSPASSKSAADSESSNESATALNFVFRTIPARLLGNQEMPRTLVTVFSQLAMSGDDSDGGDDFGYRSNRTAHLVQPIQLLSDALRELLTRPGMVDAVNAWKRRPIVAGELKSIHDANVWKTIQGPDGTSFFFGEDQTHAANCPPFFLLDLPSHWRTSIILHTSSVFPQFFHCFRSVNAKIGIPADICGAPLRGAAARRV